jgi:uncharacterized iron-regulated membrane protein
LRSAFSGQAARDILEIEMTAQPPSRYPYRHLFWKWHLYSGLLGTPLLILIAVTGAILVFAPEIDHWLRPDLWRIEPATAVAGVSDQSLFDTVRARHPDVPILSYKQNTRPDEPYQFMLFKPGMSGVLDVWINPYSGELVGERHRETAFVRIMEQLHRRLLTGEIGSSIIELMTGWGIVLCLTGLFMWWPRTRRQLRQGLTTTTRGGAYRFVWRLHNAVGGWTAAAILILALTGMVFSTFTGAMYQRVAKAAGATNPLFQGPQSTVVPGASTVSLDVVIAQARREAAGVPFSVQIPAKPDGGIIIHTLTNSRASLGELLRTRSWSFDRYSGKLLQTAGWSEVHPIRQFWYYSLVLHFGSVFGLPTKILATLACLAIPILGFTGYLIWWWKGRREKRTTRVVAAGARELPVRLQASISKGLVACLIVVCLVFPVIGASFLLVALVEGIGGLMGRWRRAADACDGMPANVRAEAASGRLIESSEAELKRHQPHEPVIAAECS